MDEMMTMMGDMNLMTVASDGGMHRKASSGLFDHDTLIIRRTLLLLLLLLHIAASMPAATAAVTAEASMTGTRTCIIVTIYRAPNSVCLISTAEQAGALTWSHV